MNRNIVAYVERVIDVQSFTNYTTNKQFQIFKFVVNNAAGIVIQCNVYDDVIPKIKQTIKENIVSKKKTLDYSYCIIIKIPESRSEFRQYCQEKHVFKE